MKKLNGYELTRRWFDFAFESQECKTQHTAIFLWIVELNNRLGWKELFGLPTHATMEGLGIGNKRTYIDALRQLNEWGFIKIVSESKNQFSSTIISICHGKSRSENVTALDTALSQHCPSTGHGIGTGIAPIDKPLNQETIKPLNIIEPNKFDSDSSSGSLTEIPNAIPNSEKTTEKKKVAPKKKSDFPIVDMEAAWSNHLQTIHSISYYADGRERAALIDIGKKLIFQINERAKREGVINPATDQEKVLNGWNYILANFPKWSDFNQKLTKLSQINGQFTNIIAECKSVGGINSVPKVHQEHARRASEVADLLRAKFGGQNAEHRTPAQDGQASDGYDAYQVVE